ncbi:MAG: hypothetical protein WCK13_01935 [Ignavibacteriota bacterium]
MENLSSVAIIKSFSKLDHKQFRSFLTFHKLRNTGKMYRIYKVITRNTGKKYDENLLLTQIKFAASPEGNANTARQNIAMLGKVLKEFLSLKKYQEDLFMHDIFTAQQLMHRNLSAQLADHIENMEKKLKDKNYIDVGKANEDYWVNIHKYNYLRKFQPLEKEKTLETENGVLENISVNFLSYFLLEMMSYYNNLIIQSENVKYNFEKNKLYKIVNLLDIEKMLKVLEGTEYHLIVSLYYLATKLVTGKASDDYFRYKKQVYSNLTKFSQQERSYHFTNLLNYCTYKINLSSAKNEFFDELVELQKTILFNKYYISKTNVNLTHEMFWSVVIGLIRNGKKNEALKVINEYKDELPEYLSECMYNMGLAYLANVESRSKDSINYLIRVSLEYLPYKLDFNLMMIKNFYELQYKIEAIQTIEIHEKTLELNCAGNELLMERHTNFAKYLKHLLYKYQKLDALKEGFAELKKLKNVVEREWLIRQYEIQMQTVKKKGYVSPTRIGIAN